MKLLEKTHPLVVAGFLKLTLGLKILQWLVISVDIGFLTPQIVLPLLNSLKQSIEFLIIHRVVQDATMKHFRMIAYWLTYLT
jgi:hypothetical protein